MLYNLDNKFTDYVTNKENLPLLIVIAAVVLIVLVLVIVMIVRTVKAKKRNRRETEEAVRALANVPPDEEYLPYSPENEVRTPAAAEEPEEEPAAEEPEDEVPVEKVSEEAPEEEPAAEEPEAVAEEPEEEVTEETAEPEAPAEETQEEEQEMAEKKAAAPAKKAEPAKKDVKKPVKKAEPAKKETKKADAPKVSAANGKWVIEDVKGKFWLTLYAPNGQVMLESPTAYASLASARSGIKTYQDNIAAGKLEITEHKNGDSQVQVLNGRGGLLATSSTYPTRAQAESALASIKRWAPTTAIEEITKK